jgi:hypothetical protein
MLKYIVDNDTALTDELGNFNLTVGVIACIKVDWNIKFESDFEKIQFKFEF